MANAQNVKATVGLRIQLHLVSKQNMKYARDSNYLAMVPRQTRDRKKSIMDATAGSIKLFSV